MARVDTFLLPKWSSLRDRPDRMRRLENALIIDYKRLSATLGIDGLCPGMASAKWLYYAMSN